MTVIYGAKRHNLKRDCAFKGKILEIFHTSNYIVKEETENEEVVFFIVIVILNILRL